jgi:hypothetical protein
MGSLDSGLRKQTSRWLPTWRLTAEESQLGPQRCVSPADTSCLTCASSRMGRQGCTVKCSETWHSEGREGVSLGRRNVVALAGIVPSGSGSDVWVELDRHRELSSNRPEYTHTSLHSVRTSYIYSVRRLNFCICTAHSLLLYLSSSPAATLSTHKLTSSSSLRLDPHHGSRAYHASCTIKDRVLFQE